MPDGADSPASNFSRVRHSLTYAIPNTKRSRMTRTAATIDRRAFLCAAAGGLALAGCRTTARKPVDPWRGARLPKQITTHELVQHVNRTAEQLGSWRCNDVKVKLGRVPMPVSARMAVSSPRNFRLQVGALTAELADIGSNADRMWFWLRQGGAFGDSVCTVRHAEFADAQRLCTANGVSMPFQPDWLLEVLGVVPIDPNAVTLDRDPSNAGIYWLTGRQVGGDGRQTTRVVSIDAGRGHVLAHMLFETDSGRPLAKAELNDYRRCQETGLVLPHKITLDWPEGGVQHMTLNLGRIDVNPGLPEQLWVMPKKQSVLNLATGTRVG